MAEVVACTQTTAGGPERGELVDADDPRVAARPELFTAWSPPLLELPDEDRSREVAVVVDSFATDDRVLIRGDVLALDDPLVRQVPKCVSAWKVPTQYRLANGEVWTEPQRRPLRRWLKKEK
jgi:hypothetical protein